MASRPIAIWAWSFRVEAWLWGLMEPLMGIAGRPPTAASGPPLSSRRGTGEHRGSTPEGCHRHTRRVEASRWGLAESLREGAGIPRPVASWGPAANRQGTAAHRGNSLGGHRTRTKRAAGAARGGP